jgi:hypothetical protein
VSGATDTPDRLEDFLARAEATLGEETAPDGLALAQLTGDLDRAAELLPEERPYPVADELLAHLRA